MSENINEIAGVEPSFKMDELKFNEKGLIPAIVQDHYSKKVLMMAWMNKESLEISLRDLDCRGSQGRSGVPYGRGELLL